MNIYIKKKIERLENGETFITSEKGNSMTPMFYSNEKFILKPTTLDECEVGDVVFCRVKSNYFTHLVKGKNDKKGLLIGNNHGHINGWTKTVFGKAEKIIDK